MRKSLIFLACAFTIAGICVLLDEKNYGPWTLVWFTVAVGVTYYWLSGYLFVEPSKSNN